MSDELHPFDPAPRRPVLALDSPLPVAASLYEAERVIVYLVRSRHGQRLLGYLASDSAQRRCDLLAPLGDQALRRLLDAMLDLRQALTGSRLWLRQEDHRSGEVRIHLVAPDRIPNQYLPEPGTMLAPVRPLPGPWAEPLRLL